MAKRRVKKSGKDASGNITSLCNATETWSPRTKADAIKDIEDNLHSYYVNEDNAEVLVKVVVRDGKKHLQTTSDAKSKNNLHNLADC